MTDAAQLLRECREYVALKHYHLSTHSTAAGVSSGHSECLRCSLLDSIDAHLSINAGAQSVADGKIAVSASALGSAEVAPAPIAPKAPTPETDEQVFKAARFGAHVVPADFVRNLERQRNHWKSLIDGASEGLPPSFAAPSLAPEIKRRYAVVGSGLITNELLLADVVIKLAEDANALRESATLAIAKERAGREADVERVFASIEAEITHIEDNARKVGGLPSGEDEGRCRKLCAMYLREFIINARNELTDAKARMSKRNSPPPCQK